MFTPRRIVHSLITLLMLATLGMAQNKPTTQTSPNSKPRKTENFAAEMKRLRDTWVQEFNARNAIFYGVVKRADVRSRRCAHRIREGNGSHSDILEPDQRILHDFCAPRFFIRIPEGHRNIDH